MTCPLCQSSDWKTADLVHSEGIQSINTTTSSSSIGIGVGAGSVGVGVGVGHGTTTGMQQSALSKRAAPPFLSASTIQEKFVEICTGLVTGILGVIFLFVGIRNLNIAELAAAFVFLSIPTLFIFAARKAKGRLASYEIAKAKWERTRMCTRCGHFYVPEMVSAAPVLSPAIVQDTPYREETGYSTKSAHTFRGDESDYKAYLDALDCALKHPGDSALQLGIFQKNIEVLKGVISSDIKFGVNDLTSAAIFAAQAGRGDCLKLLLDSGANPSPTPNIHGKTPLNAAINSSNTECIKILLERGVNPNQKDVIQKWSRKFGQ